MHDGGGKLVLGCWSTSHDSQPVVTSSLIPLGAGDGSLSSCVSAFSMRYQDWLSSTWLQPRSLQQAFQETISDRAISVFPSLCLPGFFLNLYKNEINSELYVEPQYILKQVMKSGNELMNRKLEITLLFVEDINFNKTEC